MHSSAPGKQQKLEECRPWKTHPVSNVFFKLKTKWWWQQIINFPSLQCAMFQSTCDAKNCSSYPGHPTLLAAPGEHLQGRGPKSEEASVGPDLNRISAKDIELHRNTFHLTIQSTPKSAKLGMFAIILVSHHLPNHLWSLLKVTYVYIYIHKSNREASPISTQRWHWLFGHRTWHNSEDGDRRDLLSPLKWPTTSSTAGLSDNEGGNLHPNWSAETRNLAATRRQETQQPCKVGCLQSQWKFGGADGSLH